MALAYHILAHRTPAQVERLIRVLQHPEDVFVLHFDRRAPAALHELGRQLAREHRNVVVQRSRRVLWGGPQIPDVQIEAMTLALRHPASWSHFINLSGQDFPIARRSTVVTQLAAHASTQFVDWFDPEVTRLWPNLDQRLSRWHLPWPWLHAVLTIPGLGRRLRSIFGWQNQLPYLPGYRRPVADFFHYYGGSNHAVIGRAGCEYLAHAPAAQRIRRWLAHSAIPDESVFQTVLLNSPLRADVVNRHWRFFEFTGVDKAHPVTFRAEDFDRLTQSGAWFARKFDPAVDAEILDRLEQHLQRPG